ncbi:MAG: glycosyltransferase family 2 protein [Coriobacteriia bacterium]|nr:glycosyltransferase family 2 protein [Coriobacteriia bacterium]
MSTQERRGDTLTGFGAPEDPIDVTILLPAYNEVDSVEGIYRQIIETFAEQVYSYEILFVDDGSNDGTWPKIAALCAQDSRVRALRHRRNFGKASALANGFAYARGEIIVTSDADMQYDPHDILRLIDKVIEGNDVVSAYKVLRRDPLSKRIPSKFFNFFVRSATGVPLHDMNAGLKAFRYDAADDLIRYGYGELHRFFVVLAARRGYSVAEVPVESLYRTTGTSKYGPERYVRGALDFLTVFFLSGYAERPLHLLGGVGLLLTAAGSAIFLALLVVALRTGWSMSESPFLNLGLLLVVTGIQLFVSGLIAELINSVERRDSGRVKIAQVVGIERRTSPLLAPGVQVERRQLGARSVPAPHSHVVQASDAVSAERSGVPESAVARVAPAEAE